MNDAANIRGALNGARGVVTSDPGVVAPTIRAAAQVRALATPARQEIVDVLESAGPCSVATLASLVGRPADALYHHLKRLMHVGLIIETERRKDGRHVFAVYDLAARPLQIEYGPQIKRGDIAKVFAAAVRLGWRDFRKSLIAGAGTHEGPRRTLWGARAKGWATPERLERVNRLLAELLATVRGGAPEAGAIPIAFTFLLSPARSPRRASGIGGSRTSEPSSRSSVAKSKKTAKGAKR